MKHPAPTPERINELAAEAAHHVAESGSPNARQHIIAHAITIALSEKRSWYEEYAGYLKTKGIELPKPK